MNDVKKLSDRGLKLLSLVDLSELQFADLQRELGNEYPKTHVGATYQDPATNLIYIKLKYKWKRVVVVKK